MVQYKIAIEAQHILRKEKHGMEIAAIELIKKLQKIDASNEYFIFVAPGEDKACVDETENFHIVELPFSNQMYWQLYALPKAVKEFNCHLLHCTCTTVPIFHRVPTIRTIHKTHLLCSWSELLKSAPWRQIANAVYNKIALPHAIRQSEAILVSSRNEKKTIETHIKLPDEKIKTVYNACNKYFTNESSANDKSIKEKLNIPDDYILSIGSTEPQKNTHNVLHAYAQYVTNEIDPLPLVLLNFDKALLRSYLPARHKPIVMQQITAPGYVPNEQMPALYRNANLFLYPSQQENCGIPLMEAMCCGVPILTSETSYMSEIARNSAIYVDPNNVNEIAEKTQEILSDPLATSQKVLNGLARTKYFSGEKTAERTHSIYMDTLHRIDTTILQPAHYSYPG